MAVRPYLRYQRSSIRIFLFVLPLLLPSASRAIPAFARQYGTSCATCHIDFPKLNDFGKAFRDAGFKFPQDDSAMLKIPPVMLGAPANKELWPRLIRAKRNGFSTPRTSHTAHQQLQLICRSPGPTSTPPIPS